MGLFQLGTVIFPQGNNFSNYIILYGCALKHIDGKMLILKRLNG